LLSQLSSQRRAVHWPIVIVATPNLSSADRAAIRRLLDDAFAGDFSDDDWTHALGGWHALARDGESLVAHASVVERRLVIGTQPFRTGYVEAVAVTPSRQRRGAGTAVVAAIGDLIRARFELGALSSGEWGFYERLGWERWRGPTWVRAADGVRMRTPQDDDGVMVLRVVANQPIDVTEPIECEARAGDHW
jgi:aminoglycoside 2'-N-acetyltransferase I